MDIEEIRAALAQYNVIMSEHAIERATERLVTVRDIMFALNEGEVLEDYPNAKRGPCCLVLGYTKRKKPLHVVCAQDETGSLIIITVYRPEAPKWINERTRAENG